MGKREHLKDYTLNEDGSYEYTGVRWSWPSPEVREAFVRSTTGLFAAAVVCLIGAGCIPAPGTFGAFYIVLPYLIGAVGTALSGVSLLRIRREENPMRGHVYSSSIPSLPAKLLVGALGSIVCAFASLAHGLAVGLSAAGGSIALSILFSVLMAAVAASLLRIHSQAKGLVFTPDR